MGGRFNANPDSVILLIYINIESFQQRCFKIMGFDIETFLHAYDQCPVKNKCKLFKELTLLDMSQPKSYNMEILSTDGLWSQPKKEWCPILEWGTI